MEAALISENLLMTERLHASMVPKCHLSGRLQPQAEYPYCREGILGALTSHNVGPEPLRLPPGGVRRTTFRTGIAGLKRVALSGVALRRDPDSAVPPRSLAPLHLYPPPCRSRPIVQISEQLLQRLPRPLCHHFHGPAIRKIRSVSCQLVKASACIHKPPEVHALHAPAHNGAQSDTRLIVNATPPGC
jgi:hypothetical protein